MDRSSGLRQTPGQFLEFSGVGASKLCDQEDSVGELGGDDRIRHQKQRWRIDQQDVVQIAWRPAAFRSNDPTEASPADLYPLGKA